MNHISFAFFGTPEFSANILQVLKQHALLPTIVVTAPDKKVGRKQVITYSAVKQWALENNIKVIQPHNPSEIASILNEKNINLNIVAAYGYILKKDILDIPQYGTLNVHTSLLPKYRGASPIESALKAGDEITGSTIMLMDEKMDHGPIITQEILPIQADDDQYTLFEKLSIHGGTLLASTIVPWVSGEISPKEQDHDKASYCYKIEKSDGNISNDTDIEKIRKYKAFKRWPGVFFFDNGKRIKVTEAECTEMKFNIISVIPEGKNEMSYQQYLQNKST